MIPGVDGELIRNLIVWVGTATGAEQDTRLESVRATLLDGAGEEDAARIQQLIDQAVAALPKLPAPTTPPAPKTKRKPPVQVYASSRRGYMRATKEEGIGAELEVMNAAARGSPFFGGELYQEKDAPSSSTAIIEQLKRKLEQKNKK